MNNRPIVILALVTALVAAAAFFSLRDSQVDTAANAGIVGGRLLSGLTDRVNDAAAVTVASKNGTFTLEKTEAGWGMRDKGGYPVDFDMVKALVLGLAELEVLEQKTSNPAYYAKLGVEEVGPEAASKRVKVEDAAGTVLADLVIGNARASSARGAGAGSLYVREQGAPTSFEVSGTLRVDDAASNWLDKQIIKLDKQRVRRVEIRHPDGEVVAVEKADATDEHFEVLEFPEGREPVWEGIGDSIGGGLGWVNLEDVGPDLVDFDAHEITTTQFTCFDGYVVTAETVEVDAKTYLRIRGDLDVTQRADHVEVGPAAPEDETEAEDEEEAGPTADEVRDEAEALNAKTEGWIYEIPGYRAGDLRKRMTDLLAPLEEDEPEGGDDSAPPAPTGTTGLPPEVLEQLQAQGLLDENGQLIAAPGEEPAPATEEPR